MRLGRYDIRIYIPHYEINRKYIPLLSACNGDRIYARWTCTGKTLQGCGGPFTVVGGTGKLSTISGQGDFMMQSTAAEVVVTIPAGGATGSFAGKVEWPALTLVTK